MTKDYVSQIIDLTGDSYLNPVPAIYDNGQHPRSVGQITSISIHHDAMDRPHDYDSVARYHQEAAGHYDRLGPGLQYHYKIDNVGQIFAIRPWTTWLYCVGSAENVTTLAICLDGNMETQLPTLEQCEALFQLLKNLCTQHPEFPATWPDVRPHADFSSTACCGANERPYVFNIKDEATALQFPANTGYDWPSYQPGYERSIVSVSAPVSNPAASSTSIATPAPVVEQPTAPGSTVTTLPVAPSTPPPVVPVDKQTPCAPIAPPAAPEHATRANHGLLAALWAIIKVRLGLK